MRDARSACERMPLSALMSEALVAFTIEFDNEFEHQMPHRTTNHGSTPCSGRVPWLVSMAMWVHCMRYVPATGISAGDLIRRGQLPGRSSQMVLERMSRWWGYLTVKPDPSDARAKPPPAAWKVRPTRAGRRAQHVWEPLTELIESRWRHRFGAGQVDQLEATLGAVVSQLDMELPDYMPIAEQSQSLRVAPTAVRPALTSRDRCTSDSSVSELLSKLLVAFTLEFESGSAASLALGGNVLRILDDQGVLVRDLPALTGVAAIGVENSLSLLEKRGYVTIRPERAGTPTRAARLTAKGRRAQDTYSRRVAEIEHDWEGRYGEQTMRALRDSLEALVGTGRAEDSPLFEGLEPYPDGWRAHLPEPDTLPHYPMVSHRGGFPDGS